MLKAVQRRLQGRREEGFTLIELMVVVLIIAILIAIAIPTFLGARQRAQDRAAQSVLRNALTTEKTYYTDNQTYTTDAAALKAIEPSIGFLPWYTEASGAKNEVTLYFDGNAYGVLLVSRSASGQLFSLKSSEAQFGSSGAGVYYRRGDWTGWTDPVACNCGWSTTGW